MPECITVTAPSLDEVRAARERQREVIVRTPLVPLHDFQGPSNILLKPEIHQPVTSFKLRGMYNAVAALSDDQRARGISTVSAGNTAQALAWCGRHFGIHARSLMPDHAPQSKIDAVLAYGGEPVLVPGEDVFRYLREHEWEAEPYSFMHPWFNRHIITGYGSIALEILEDCPEIDAVLVPVGGGGLISGVGGAIKALKPEVKVIAVEPEGCPSLHASLKAGQPKSVECDTICDGVAVPYITQELFPLLREIVDETVLVSESDVKTMVRRLALGNKMVVEPSGALAAAAADRMFRDSFKRCVCIVSGGSIDREKLIACLNAD